MNHNSKCLAPNLLRRMDKCERDALGRNGLLPEERQAKIDVKLEKELQNYIVSYCVRNDWLYLRQRMDRKATSTIGQPDFIIFPGANKTLLVECKTASGRLSDAQAALFQKFEQRGYKVHLVRSYVAFFALLKAEGLT